MGDERARRALERIERALARAEAAAGRASAPDATLFEAHERLRARVGSAIAELDRLLEREEG